MFHVPIYLMIDEEDDDDEDLAVVLATILAF